MKISGFKKIAVLKTSALGDFIFALPALSALRKAYPKAEIVYLGEKWHQEFLTKRQSPIDRVTIIPKVAGVGMQESYQTNNKELEDFFRKIRQENFDLAVQLHGGGRFSNPFLLNLGAKFTIGVKTDDAPDLDLTIPYQYYQSEYLRWLEVVSLIGIKSSGITPKLEVSAEDIKEAKEVLGEDSKKIIVIHPGARDIRRRWPVERFSGVGDYFSKQGFKVVVTGSYDEKDLVENVITNMEYKALNFYKKLSLGGLVGLLSFADLVISNDTGPLHLADAIGSKTVGIYWCGNLINGSPPFRKKSRCLGSWVVNCPLCGKDCASNFPFQNETDGEKGSCKHKESFVTGVKTQDVINAALSLL